MTQELTRKLLAKPTTGVPRRMALGALFVLVSLFCVIFKALTWVGMNPAGILAVAVYCTAIATGQAVLFEGRRPRDASVLVGTIAMPILICLAGAYAYFMLQLTVLESISLIPLAGCSLLIAPLIGYLVGIFLAGGFLLFETWATGQTPDSDELVASAPVDGRSITLLQQMPAWLRNHPLILAALTYLFPAMLLGFLGLAESEHLATAVPSTYLIAGIFMLPLIPAILSGVFQLRAINLLLLFPAFFAGCAISQQLAGLHIAESFGTAMKIWVPISGSLLIGLISLAMLGWIQFFLSRTGNRKSLFPTWFVCAITLAILATSVGWLWVSLGAYARSPAEMALKKAAQSDCHLQYAWSRFRMPALPPFVIGLSIANTNSLQDVDPSDQRMEDVFSDLDNHVDLSRLQSIWAHNAPPVGDRVVKLADGKRLWNLVLMGTGISDRAFADVQIATTNLNLSRTNISDVTLDDLTPGPNQPRTLQMLSLADTKITDKGLIHIMAHSSLRALDLSYCDITGEGFVNVPPHASPIAITLTRSKLSDEGLVAIFKAFPMISNLDISGTSVTQAGLERATSGYNTAIEITLEKKQFDLSFLEDLMDQNGNVSFQD